MKHRPSVVVVIARAAARSYNIIASRIPAARPEGSLFAVPGLLSVCVRKLHYPAEEEDDECLSILPERMTVCLSNWEDLVKKGAYQNWYHPDLVGRVCIRTWYQPAGVLQSRRELQHFAIYKHRPWPILKFEFLMSSQMFSDYLSFFLNY